MMRALSLALGMIAIAAPAHAGPLVAALSSLFAGMGGFFAAVGATKVGAFLIRAALSIGLSLLSKSQRKQQRAPGIVTEITTSGGITPQKFIVGRYATGGQLIAPPMSYGMIGSTQRAYLVYAIAVSAFTGVTLQRVMVNDAYVELSPTRSATWGFAGLGTVGSKVMIDFLDGRQSGADADMLAAFGTDPDRPWLADMVGPGTVWLKARFAYDREAFNGLPTVRVEVLGIPLYDPRFDSSVGGLGPQRWNTPATWVQTTNPIVIIYNIMRGLRLPEGDVWGGECLADDLPLANWAAAMNECDLPPTGATGPQYQCGFEIALSDAPAEVIAEILKTCSGQMVEIGGTWKVRVGAPAMPTFFLIDDDILVSREQEYLPFPGLSDTYNAISSTYPEPASLWEAKEAPPRYNAAWEAADGNRRLIAPYDLPACPYPDQVQRLMASMIADHRRFRSHRFGLPPEAAVLEPLETVSWVSAKNGYAGKLFEVTSMTDQLMTLTQAVALRERDAADYTFAPSSLRPSEPSLPGVSAPPASPPGGGGGSSAAVTRALGPSAWQVLSPAAVVLPASSWVVLLSDAATDTAALAPAQHAIAAIRCYLTGSTPRWITLRLTLGWPSGNEAVALQSLYLRPGADLEFGFAAPAETTGDVQTIELAARPDDLVSGESVTISAVRARLYSYYR